MDIERRISEHDKCLARHSRCLGQHETRLRALEGGKRGPVPNWATSATGGAVTVFLDRRTGPVDRRIKDNDAHQHGRRLSAKRGKPWGRRVGDTRETRRTMEGDVKYARRPDPTAAPVVEQPDYTCPACGCKSFAWSDCNCSPQQQIAAANAKLREKDQRIAELESHDRNYQQAINLNNEVADKRIISLEQERDGAWAELATARTRLADLADILQSNPNESFPNVRISAKMCRADSGELLEVESHITPLRNENEGIADAVSRLVAELAALRKPVEPLVWNKETAKIKVGDVEIWMLQELSGDGFYWRSPKHHKTVEEAEAEFERLVSILQRRQRATERKIICLCGSTKFKVAYREWNARLTLDGHVVLSVAMWSHSEQVRPTLEEKKLLDAIHKSKIDLADEVFVLDVNGYVGESTRSEIDYALTKGKQVRYLSVEYPKWTEADAVLTERRQPSAKVAKLVELLEDLKDLVHDYRRMGTRLTSLDSPSDMANRVDEALALARPLDAGVINAELLKTAKEMYERLRHYIPHNPIYVEAIAAAEEASK